MAAELSRLYLRRFFSVDLCKELEFIHRSCGTVGYRPNVFSTTLSHLAATNCGHLIIPFVAIRERLKEKVEEFFGYDFELFIEFTGLISWCKGASIGWHSDDNRPYLKQRDFAAVCYLNSHGKDFEGGAFRFKDGEPSFVVPAAGDVLIYTADDRNIHAVDEVLHGERLTLTLWFTRNCAHNEDAKLLPLLFRTLPIPDKGINSLLPLPGSNNMYWFSNGSSGFDIRCARITSCGFKFCSLKHQKFNKLDPLDVLNMPLYLSRGEDIYSKEFANSLHGLQLLQFYYFKASELLPSESAETPLLKGANGFELILPCDHQLAAEVIGFGQACDHESPSFSWDLFMMAATRWEEYTRSLYKELLTLVPHWVSHQTIFVVPDSDFLTT